MDILLIVCRLNRYPWGIVFCFAYSVLFSYLLIVEFSTLMEGKSINVNDGKYVTMAILTRQQESMNTNAFSLSISKKILLWANLRLTSQKNVKK